MWFCENCGCEITGEVFGTGCDATGYCSSCDDNVNCYYDDENIEDPMERKKLDTREIGI